MEVSCNFDCPYFSKTCFGAVLFNLCDGAHWCGWENLVVRMTNTVRMTGRERMKKPCCVVINIF